MNQNNSNLDIAPVALIFFNRPNTLKLVFDEIKKARPPRLFLIQDGARAGNDNDTLKINECRRIVEDIDWECEVEKNYSDTNLGCGLRPYSGIKWVFEQVDRAIILEDDCVPSQSFFYFCSEMLDRYAEDQRIFLITGMNMELETKEYNYSYFFGYSGTNWGWASWRRCWERVDYNMEFVQDSNLLYMLKNKLKLISGKKGISEINLFLKTHERLLNEENISYWDVQWQSVRYLYNQLSIIPTKNLITNIGIGEDSTHAKQFKINNRKKVGDINFFFNKRFEISFPLAHPMYMIQNVDYDNKVNNKLYPNIFTRIIIKIKKKFSFF